MAHVSPAGLIAMSVILDVFAVSAVALRFMARRDLGTGYGADDWLILGAVVFSTGFAVMEIYGAATKTFGIPLVDVPGASTEAIMYQFSKALRIEMISFHISVICLSLVRLSLAFLYRRVFATPTFRQVINVWIVFLVLYMVAFEVGFLCVCGDHLADFWDMAHDYTRYCSASLPISQAQVCVNMFLDLGAIVLPIPMIWSMSLSVKRKCQIAALFAAALLSLVCSITKAGIYLEWTDGAKQENPITTLTVTCVLLYVEMQIGVMVACAPLCRRMVPPNVAAMLSEKLSLISHRRARRSVSDDAFVPAGSGVHKTTAYRVTHRRLEDLRNETPCHDQIWVDTTISVESNSAPWKRSFSSHS